MIGKQLSKSLSINGFTVCKKLESSINNRLTQINNLYSQALHDKIFESIRAKTAFLHIKKTVDQMNTNLAAIDLIIHEAQNTNDENTLLNTLKHKYTYIDNVFNEIAPHRMLLNYVDTTAFPTRIDKDLFKSIFNTVVEKAQELQIKYAQKEHDLMKRDIESIPFSHLKDQYNEINHHINQIAKIITIRIKGRYAIDPNQYAWVIIAQMNLNHFEHELNAME